MALPSLSVIMPNYNHARFLPGALQAVLDQSVRPKEILLVDDASTDDSVAVIERFAERHPVIRFHRNERNLGVVANIRRMLEMATGDYVVGCACDDRVLPGFFEKSLTLLGQHPGAGLCSSLSLVMNEAGEMKGLLPSVLASDRPCFLPPGRARRLLGLYGNWILG